jgi:hypothetical protein
MVCDIFLCISMVAPEKCLETTALFQKQEFKTNVQESVTKLLSTVSWLTSWNISLKVINIIYESENWRHSHLCKALLIVASVSEKLRCRLGEMGVSTFSRITCNELDFRRFDWRGPMSHGGSGRLKERKVSCSTGSLASSCSWVYVETCGLNKQWRACRKNTKPFFINTYLKLKI